MGFVSKIKKAISDSALYKRYIVFKRRERRVRHGRDFPNKTFYVIGQDDLSGGMWWLINKTIMHIAYARDKGYIPVIDLQNNRTQYTQEDTFGHVNVWELFLEQPSGFSLDSNGSSAYNISHAKNIIINKKEPAPSSKYLMGNTDFYDNPERLNYFRDIFKQYIRFNRKTITYFEFEQKKLFKGRRMCGVLCRGTDYVVKRPQGHPIQPTPEAVIKDVKAVIEKFDCEGVFLATEDLDILNLFIDTFGNKLAYVDQPRLSKRDLSAEEFLAKSKKRLNAVESVYDDGLKYLLSTYLLSKCSCFLGGRTGGCKGVLLMNNSFDYCKIYNFGLYS